PRPPEAAGEVRHPGLAEDRDVERWVEAQPVVGGGLGERLLARGAEGRGGGRRHRRLGVRRIGLRRLDGDLRPLRLLELGDEGEAGGRPGELAGGEAGAAEKRALDREPAQDEAVRLELDGWAGGIDHQVERMAPRRRKLRLERPRPRPLYGAPTSSGK